MIRKILLLLIAATIPGVIFLTVRQVYDYNQIDGEVHSLIMSQRELFEQNKRMVANLSILSSPGRIDELADGGGYIAMPSHDVPYDKNLLNAMNDEIKTYGKY